MNILKISLLGFILSACASQAPDYRTTARDEIVPDDVKEIPGTQGVASNEPSANKKFLFVLVGAAHGMAQGMQANGQRPIPRPVNCTTLIGSGLASTDCY